MIVIPGGSTKQPHSLSGCLWWSRGELRAGYGGALTPNPDCIWVNVIVTLQTVASLMLDYSMLGIVYAR